MSVTISTVFDNARTAFGKEILPEVQDQWMQPQPLLAGLFGTLAKGGVSLEMGSKQFGELSRKPNEYVLRGTDKFQQRVEFTRRTGGTQGTGGIRPKSNTETQILTMAEWRLTEDTQELATSRANWQIVKSLAAAGNASGAGGKMLNLMKTLSQNGFKTMADRVTSNLVGLNTDPAAGLLSFSAGIGAATTDNSTYGGILRSSNTWWRGNYATYDDTKVLDDSDADHISKVVREQVNAIKNNGALVNDIMIVMGSSAHNAYQQWKQGISAPTTAGDGTSVARYTDSTGRNIPGFSGYYFGPVPIIEEPNMSAWKIITYDSKSTRIIPLAGAIFEVDEWKFMENATGVYSQIELMAQLVVTNPRRNYIELDS